MRSFADESFTDEEVDELAVRVVRAIRAERAGSSWSVRKVADYLGCSTRHVRRLIAAGKLEGERPAGSRAWAVPVRSMLAFEDRRYAARVEAGRRSGNSDRLDPNV
jgi:excisionase family DNA binding protein